MQFLYTCESSLARVGLQQSEFSNANAKLARMKQPSNRQGNERPKVKIPNYGGEKGDGGGTLESQCVHTNHINMSGSLSPTLD